MFEMKFRRIQEHVQRMQDDLARPRIKISEASARWAHFLSLEDSSLTWTHSLVRYCKTTRDPLVPSIWGQTEDPYASPDKGCECILA